MSQLALVFETDLTKEELEQSLHEDGVLKHLTNYGAYPHVVSLVPRPADAATVPAEA